jgi:predicted nucleic acid-binding protein
MDYFFDSYAIIEIINQNESYKKFSDVKIITNTLNLAEVHYYFLREHNEQTADYWVSNLNFHIVDIPIGIAIDASKFRYKNKKLGLSYADCIGHITALNNNLKFITGDNKFENMPNVEFMK